MKPSDALIIGGGPAGSAAAILLAKAGWRVTIVERKEFPRRKVCGEYLSATNWPLLESLGIADAFADMAGPPVRETAIFVGDRIARALPRPRECSGLWGRALSREHLDSLLLEQAVRLGVQVRQPARCVQVKRKADGFRCRIESLPGHESEEVSTASGDRRAWLVGFRRPANGAAAANLAAWRFVGVQGSFPECRSASGPDAAAQLCRRLRRYGALRWRQGQPVVLHSPWAVGEVDSAGRAISRGCGSVHLLESCPALQPVVEGAALADSWLSAGPIRPGIRRCYAEGVFVVGNAAGEAHPVVAEGISMALQSAWLLTDRLIADSNERSVARSYTRAWRQSFAPRIRAAAAIAHWAMRPRLVAVTLPFLQTWPKLLTFGAWLSGKSKLVVQPT